MKLHFDLDQSKLLSAPRAGAIASLGVTRGAGPPLEITFYRDGQPVELAAETDIYFGAKAKVGGTLLALADTFTKAGTVWTGVFDTNTQPLADLIGNSEGLNLQADLTVIEPGDLPLISQVIQLRVQNRIFDDSENAPTLLPDPSAYIAARAIMYDRGQTLSLNQAAQARANLKLPKIGQSIVNFAGLTAAYDAFRTFGSPTDGTSFVAFTDAFDSMGAIPSRLLHELATEYGLGGLACPGFGSSWNDNGGLYHWNFTGGATQAFTDFTYMPGASEIIIPAGGGATLKIPPPSDMDLFPGSFLSDAPLTASRAHVPLPRGVRKVSLFFTKLPGAGSVTATLTQTGYGAVTSGATSTAGALGIVRIDLVPNNYFAAADLALTVTGAAVRVCMAFCFSDKGVIHWSSGKGSTNMTQQLVGITANAWNAAYAALFAAMNTKLVCQCQKVDGNPTYAQDYPKFWTAWAALGCSQFVLGEPTDGNGAGILPAEINTWLEANLPGTGVAYLDLYALLDQAALGGLSWEDDITHLDPPGQLYLAKRIAQAVDYFRPPLYRRQEHVMTRRGMGAERLGFFPFADLTEVTQQAALGNTLTGQVTTSGGWTAPSVNNDQGYILPTGTAIGGNAARIGVLTLNYVLETSKGDFAISGIGRRNMDLKSKVSAFVALGGDNFATITNLTGLAQRCFGLEWAWGPDVGSPNGLTDIVVRLWTCDGAATTTTPWYDARNATAEESVSTAGQSFVIHWDRENSMLYAAVGESTLKTFAVRNYFRMCLPAAHLAANDCQGGCVHIGARAAVAPATAGQISWLRFRSRYGDMPADWSNSPRLQKYS